MFRVVTAAQLIRRAARLGPVVAPQDKVIFYEDIIGVSVDEEWCWLCGEEVGGVGVTKKQAIKETFTNHDLSRRPESNVVCVDCAFCLGSTPLRNYSIIATVSGLRHPSRKEMRDVLLEPPEQPFVICIAVSGQKHLAIRAKVAHTRDNYPVQFEEQTVYVRRGELAKMIALGEQMYAVFSKDEILNGRYSQKRIRQYGLDRFVEDEKVVSKWRRARLFEVAVFVMQKTGLKEEEDVLQF